MKASDLVRGWPLREFLPTMIPNNATAAVVNSPAAAAWTWSAYSQITAGYASAFTPVALHMTGQFNDLVTAAVSLLVEYEVATGAAGAEVPYATYHHCLNMGMSNPGASTTAFGIFGETFPMGPTPIPASTRIAHRIRISNVNTNGTVGLSIYLAGFVGGDVPVGYRPYDVDPHWRGIHSAVSRVAPGGSMLAVTPGAAWAYGSWVQAIASAAKDLLVTGVIRGDDTTILGAHMYAEVGTGAAASEVSRGRVGFPVRTYGAVGLQRFLRPIFVKNGERVALRAAGSAATVTDMALLYEEVA